MAHLPLPYSDNQDHIMRGIAFACSAFFMFTLMQGFNKMVTGQHHPAEVAFYRNIIALIPCIIYIAITKRPELLQTKMPLTLSIRAVIGTIGLVLTLAAVQHLPMANATTLFFTSTLILPVMAHFILKEQIGLYRWGAVGFGMGGVILVAQPTPEVTVIGIVLAVSASCVHATIQILIRMMKNERAFTIAFYFFLVGVIGPGLFMPWIASMPTPESALYLLGGGITGGLGQWFLTRGFQIAPASLLSLFNYTGLLWATLLDILIWSFVPGWPVFIGASMILAANIFIIVRERRKQKNPEAPDA